MNLNNSSYRIIPRALSQNLANFLATIDSKLNQFTKTQWFLFILSLLALSYWVNRPEPDTTELIRTVVSLDTHIPKGQTLVPIHVENSKSLDQILGQFGYGDIYQLPTGRSIKKKLIARNIKIVRAAKNPNSFNVLVPEKYSSLFVGENYRFFVVLRGRNNSGTEFVETKSSRPSRFTTEEI